LSTCDGVEGSENQRGVYTSAEKPKTDLSAGLLGGAILLGSIQRNKERA
jgi:hypothetical protein